MIATSAKALDELQVFQVGRRLRESLKGEDAQDSTGRKESATIHIAFFPRLG
jgi:hypothetical protein